MRLSFRACLTACALAVAAAVSAAADETIATTTHSIAINGQRLAYTAEAGRIPIRDVETGDVHGEMFYVAYRVASRTPTTSPRPVAFIWNGGPGAPADTLHFDVAGPRRLENGALIDNAETWLTDADLVFVDPIGTGFSRPTKAEYGQEFYGTIGDVASVTEFVRVWRIQHGAENAPILLIGESWGAGRAGSVGYALEHRGIRVAGLVLISGGSGMATDPSERALVAALRVVNLTDTAFAHHMLGADLGNDLAVIHRAAEQWARQTYAPALTHVDTLTDAQRTEIVAQLARFTGIAPDRIDRPTLLIQPRQFRQTLIGADHPLNIFDMRREASAASGDGNRAALELDYLRRELGYRTDLPYVGLEPMERAPDETAPQSVGERWNYATGPATPEQVQAAMREAMSTGAGPPQIGAPLPSTAEAIALDPHLRVLVASGVFDSMANCAGYQEIGAHLSDALRTAITFKCYQGGHMMYFDAGARVALSNDIRAMARAAH